MRLRATKLSAIGFGGARSSRPSLDLQFATDKTLTARKGPTPTFTRASTATFVGSDGLIQSAAINAPRFDHDPVTLVCKGLLIEDQRTNLALQSETFPLPTWVKTNVTTSPNTLASPSGTVSADTLIEDTATSFHYISQQFAKAASSLTYSFSVYYKNASGTRTVVVALTNGTSSGKAAIFTTSGTVTATNVNIGSGVGFTFVSASVESVGNGWYRASVVVTSDISTRLDAVVYLNNSTTVINSYTGILSSVYLWGAQVELGSFSTSYIPTTTTALPRSADVCSITGSDFTGFYNNSTGTLVSQVMINNLTGGNRGITQIDDGTGLNYLRHTYDFGFISGIRSNGDTQTSLSSATGTASVIQKRAIAYQGTNFASTTNGLSVQVATRATPIGLNTIRIGGLTGGLNLSGHIAAISYYKKRLPDVKLQALTL